MEIMDFHREDHYAAQITAAIYQVWSKKEIDYTRFLLNFKKRETKPVPNMAGVDAAFDSKSIWLATLGLDEVT